MTTPATDGSERLKTPDGFVDAVKNSTPLAFAELAAGLAEADRKKLSKAAQELLQQARPKERDNFGIPTHEKHMARLALLAVGPRSQACRPMNLAQLPQTRGFRLDIFPVAHESGPNPYEQAAAQILADRKPNWADEWLASQIAGAESSPFGVPLNWKIVRRLIRTGVCRKPDSPGYLRLLAWFGLWEDFDEDPDLLDDAWDLFRVPTQAFAFGGSIKPDEAAQWKESRGQGWPQIFYYYVHQGRIDRGRLLDALLKALWGEFSFYERNGLMHFHQLLAATEHERLARQSAYIELLRNPEAPVVAFALTVIKSLANSKGFDAEAALKALPAVFELKPKSQPKAALSLLKTLVRHRPDLKTLAIEAALRGLAHPESDVQLAALKCLEAWRNDGLPSEKLADFRELVSPLALPQLNQLISGLGGSAASGVEPDELQAAESQVIEPQAIGLQAPGLPASTADLRARIEQIAPAWRAAWKLDESLSAFEAGTLPPPADIDAAPRVLVGLSRVAPIADGQELVDAVSQALERLDSPMELERILDGLSQFGLERSGDFMARTSALRKRMVETDSQMRLDSLLSVRFTLRPLFDLIGAWLGIGPSGQPSWLRGILQYSTKQSPVDDVLCQRAKMIRPRLYEQNRCGRLLSFPTHEHGWIDPRVFVERLAGLDANELGSIRPDLRCGLLRLAPDFREQTIRDAAELPAPLDRIVRYALGDDEVIPTSADRDWKAEWLAAGRVRSPRGDLNELEPLVPPAAAYALAAAQFHVRLDRVPADDEKRRNLTYTNPPPFVQISPVGPMALPAEEYPAFAIARRLSPENGQFTFWADSGWCEAWQASHWPSNPEPFVAGAIQNLLLRLDLTVQYHAAAPSLSALLNPERGWSATAIYALWLAMFSRDADARVVAIDALVEGLLDGRAHPDSLSEILIEIAGYPWAKLNRLADGLRQVARTSSWGALAISQILDRLIACWRSPPRDAHQILEIQLELLLQLNGSLSETARTPLKELAGGSKTAKLAKQLLELHGGNSTPCRAALLEGIELRIAHAERLQKQ